MEKTGWPVHKSTGVVKIAEKFGLFLAQKAGKRFSKLGKKLNVNGWTLWYHTDNIKENENKEVPEMLYTMVCILALGGAVVLNG